MKIGFYLVRSLDGIEHSIRSLGSLSAAESALHQLIFPRSKISRTRDRMELDKAQLSFGTAAAIFSFILVLLILLD